MDNAIESKIIMLNCQAMNSLNAPKKALKFLQDAESFLLSEDPEITDLPNRLSLLGVTFNNLACYYKSIKQPNVALFYLNQALNLEIETFAEPSTIASTNLNLCAIYSQLGKHKQAMTSAFSAIKYLKGYENEEEMNENIVNSIVVANYNIGVEFEYLKKMQKAIEFYSKGHRIAVNYLGINHPMAETLEESLKKAKEQCESLNSFLTYRRESRNHAKYSSQSVSPAKPEINPELRIYQSRAHHTKFPKIFKKAKHKLKTHRLSLEPLPRDAENRNTVIESGILGTRKFSDAIERLKLLLNK